jgi:hypothetical protein
MAVLIPIQEILDLLVVVEAAHQVLVLMFLGFHRVMEAMAVPLLCIMELTMEAEEGGHLVPQVRMVRRTRAEAEMQHRQ